MNIMASDYITLMNALQQFALERGLHLSTNPLDELVIPLENKQKYLVPITFLNAK